MLTTPHTEAFQQKARDVIASDLDRCCTALRQEFSSMAGGHVLLTGGAGFLGYYLVQALLEWNRRSGRGERISLTVLDNYIRGVPEWLRRLSNPLLRLLENDIVEPRPGGFGRFDYMVYPPALSVPPRFPPPPNP